MKIENMQMLTQEQRIQAAQMLTDELPLGWATLDDALEEITERVDNIERDGNGESLFLAAVAVFVGRFTRFFHKTFHRVRKYTRCHFTAFNTKRDGFIVYLFMLQ